METPSTSAVSLSSLLCRESPEDDLEEEQGDPSLLSLVPFNGLSDSEDEYVHLLLQREKSDSSPSHNKILCSSSSPPPSLFDVKLTTIARLDAINNILHIKARLGFQFQTAYLAVTYLDRFLSLRALDCDKKWATELLSMGCVSLAAKLEECNVPGLSSFQLGNFRFEVNSIQRMELLILSTLDWKMGAITPFAFLPYFINKLFGGPPPRTTLTRILELILTIMKDISLMDHYPSAIASAVVLMSLDESFTRNGLYSKINDLPCSRFLDIDDVLICYLIMQKLERNQTKILKLLGSPDVSPIKLTHHMGSFQNSPATSSNSSKKRRLSFSDSDDKHQALYDKRKHESDV